MNKVLAVISLLSISFFSASVTAKVYCWEDDQEIQNLNETSEKKLEEKDAAAKKKAEAKHNKQQCDNARENLELINNRPPQTLYSTGSGEYKRFTPEERTQELKKFNDAVEKYCR